MRTKDSGVATRRGNAWRIAGWGIAALLLLLPLAAMQVTSEVDWTASDFVFAAILIGGVGLALELVVRMTRSATYRGGVAVLAAATFLLIWINAAVGVIGNEDNPLNLLYGGVISIALGGAAIARFRARGMSRAMSAAAVVQILIGVVAVVAGRDEPPGPLGLVLLNGFFAALFAAAAWLFGRAAAVPDGSRNADVLVK